MSYCQNAQIGILISYVMSKLYKAHGDLLREKLKEIEKIGSPFDMKTNVHLLLFLVEHSPGSVLLNFEEFINAVKTYIFFKQLEVRLVAAKAVNEYITLVSKRPEANVYDYANPIFMEVMNSYYDQTRFHGVLLLLTVLFKHNLFQFFMHHELKTKIMDYLMNVAHSSDENVFLQALYCLILSSQLDKKYFTDRYLDKINPYLFPDSASYHSLLATSFLTMTKIFDDFLIKNRSKIYSILNKMLNLSIPLQQGFELLEIISKKHPDIILSNLNQLLAILSSASITADYVKYVPPIFSIIPRVQYQKFQNSFCSRLSSNLKRSPTVNQLDFIAKCEPFGNSEMNGTLLDLLDHSSPNIRAAVPAALLQNSKDLPCLPQIINQLLIKSLSESDSNVRTKTLQSFPESVSALMSSSTALSCFESLANDDCYQVRKAAIILLARIVKISPFSVLPILRRSLLDDLFLLNSQRSHRIQRDMTKLLLHLISAAENILPIYAQSICQIALEHFNSPPKREQTFFERENFFEISINFTKCIDIIAKKDINLVSNYYNKFIESFIIILKQHNKKELKIIVVETLSTFVSRCGSQFKIDRKFLFTELTGIASKWNSHKLNLAFLQLFGLIGAVDINILRNEDNNEVDKDEIESDHHKYYMNVVCRTLLNILQDNSLNPHHVDTTLQLVSIFSLKEESSFEWYLKFMPIFINEIRTTHSSNLLQLLQHLCQSVNPNWLTYFTDELIAMVYELWNTDELLNVLGIVSALAAVLMDRFAPFLPQCITLLLDCLFSNRSIHHEISQKVLESLVALRHVSDDYMFLIIPEIVSAASNPSTLDETRIDSLNALRIFLQSCECVNFSAAIVRCIIYCLGIPGEVRNMALQVLYSLQVALGSRFAHYQNVVLQALDKNKIPTSDFHLISGRKPPLQFNNFDFINTKDKFVRTTVVPRPAPKPNISNSNIGSNLSSFNNLNPNNKNIKNINIDNREPSIPIITNFVETETPWNIKEWFKKFIESIILNSPEPCIKIASNLISILPSVSESLFNAAFLSCWEKMNSEMQKSICIMLSKSLSSSHLSENARSLLVDLIEFMDRSESSIGIEPKLLCNECYSSGHHARAFYFAYRWFQKDHSNQASEIMIKTASTLGLRQTVIGLSDLFARDTGMDPKSLEQLGKWKEALDIYMNDNSDIGGRLRCMKYLMMWNEIISYTSFFEKLENSDERKPEIASSIIAAMYNLSRYSEIPKLLKYCSDSDTSSYILAAISEFKNKHTDQSFLIISKAFDNLARKAQTMFKYDNSMLYSTVLEAMKLTELSEILNKNVNKNVWAERLALCRKTFDAIYNVLSVRFCFAKTFEQSTTLLKRALKRSSRTRNWSLFEAVENELFPQKNERPNEIIRIEAMAKWEQGLYSEALEQIMNINIDTAQDLSNTESNKFASKISFLRGQWILRMTPPKEVSKVVEKVIPHLKLATELDPNNYKAWHRWAWASANIFHADNHQINSAVDAINGFMKCVKLHSSSSYSDLLQMISLFFRADLDSASFDNVSNLISSLDDSDIIKIYQHIFAQFDSKKSQATIFAINLIKNRLHKLFHVLLYPILLLKRSGKENEELANDLLQNLRVSNPAALYQAEIITNGLLSASYLKIERRINVLNKLHKILSKYDPKDLISGEIEGDFEADVKKSYEILLKELSIPNSNNSDSIFDKKFRSRFDLLKNSLQKIIDNPDISNISLFFKLLKFLYAKLKRKLSHIKTIKLSDVSPDLASLHDSILAVPGTYNAQFSNEQRNIDDNSFTMNQKNSNFINPANTTNDNLITIKKFHTHLELISSKQYPRLVTILGSDGLQHSSLLKGQEDLRLDQQVMQFFELINIHIANGFPPESRFLRLHTYAITPLSKKSGLIQFLDNTETLYNLIKKYRMDRNIDINLENEYCNAKYSSAINLRPIQRLEILRKINKKTPGNELREIIWLKSENSMNWISRTINFSHTSAIVSIVGYILGLGDRHPTNIMIHKYSGDIIHIDFGECFEMSKKSLLHPETVPFRLTRMIQEALGPSGIEGEFRLTCEETMKLIRGHRESIMTVLNLFLKLPLEGTTKTVIPDDLEIKHIDEKPNSELENSTTSILLETPSFENYDDVDTEIFLNKIADEQFEVAFDDKTTELLNISSALEDLTDKIIGKDFESDVPFGIKEQVNRLIINATDEYNLSSMSPLWLPFW